MQRLRNTKMLTHIMKLLATLILIHTDYNQAFTPEAPAVAAANSNSAVPTDTFYIRHGRSRVRHSNEKNEHILWGMRATHISNNSNTLTHDYDGGSVGAGTAYDNETSGSSGVTTLGGRAAVSRNVGVSSIPSGNGHLFGSEYWQHSDANGTIINQVRNAQPASERSAAIRLPSVASTVLSYRDMATPTATPHPATTLMPPVTHKIRKLHKKKIMESIRKSVDKGLGIGARLSKNHRSLAEAEHMQGRPTDVSEDFDDDDDDDGDNDDDNDEDVGFNVDEGRIGDELGEVMQLAEELDLDEAEVGAYQNDEYVTTAATSITSRPAADTIPDDMTYATFAPVARAPDIDSVVLDENDNGLAEETTAIPTATVQSSTYKRKFDFYEHANEVLTVLNKRLPKNQTKPLWERQSSTEMQVSNKIAPQAVLVDKQPIEDSTEADYVLDKSGNELNEASLNDEEDDTYELGNSAQEFSEPNILEINNRTSFPVNDIDSDSLDLDGEDTELVSAPTYIETTEEGDLYSLSPSQSASTSVGGIGLDHQPNFDLEEINFDDVGIGLTHSFSSEEGTMDDGLIEHRMPNELPSSSNVGSSDSTGTATDTDDGYETNRFLAGVIDAANEDEIYDWDEISRNNRRNLMRGRDVVTKFLQIVETQHSLGSNCEAGTSLNLGEGVVDRYAQDRFRVEAEVAVNRANMLTRIFKMTARTVQADVNLLHASVLSMVEFDDDIFAAGNCFDWNEHPSQPGLFCPFAYRLPPPNLGAIFAKDLATEYHYLGNTSEWFFQARKNAEKVIAHNQQYLKAFHLYSNRTDERIEDETLAVKYEDGRWSKPYYDCGGGNIWMLTYTVPFFGYENGTYHFKGTSGIDIDLRRVDIDQCPQRNTPGTTQPLNIFAGTDKCKQRTTMCEALKGLGFRRGSYKCVCRKGYYFPDTTLTLKFFNGSLLEEEYEKLMLGKNSTYNIVNEYECLPCAEGCDYCEDGSPCIAALNWPMRTSILVLACTVIGLLPPAAWFTFRYQQVKVVRAASPALLRVIALGAFFIYCTNIVMYPNPNLYTCTARIWLREIGFSLTYGALMLKTWRISVIFRVRSAKAVKITDAALLKRLGIICGVIGTCLLVRTLVSPPDVVVGRTADDLKAFLCKTDYWDYTFTSMEVLFLAWGVRLCIMVRKAPSEFNESRFISMAIYNEFLMTCFLNVSMIFLQSPANPDLLYIIFFSHTQLTVTLLLVLIFGSKVYIVLRSGKSHQESIGLGAKSSGAKFNFRPQVRTFANPSSITTSTAPVAGTTSGETKLSDQEALEEIRQLSMQLQRIQEMAPPKGVAVMTISSLLDGLKTPGGMMMVAAAAAQAAQGNQLMVRPAGGGEGGGGAGALPLLALNTEMQKYNKLQQQLQLPMQQQSTNNNISGSGKPHRVATTVTTNIPTTPSVIVLTTPLITAATPTEKELPPTINKSSEKAINTVVSGELSQTHGHIICERCLESSREHYYSCRPLTPPTPPSRLPTACQQLGSPQPEGSISFANIKLECMCSQSDDLDQPTARRRVNQRSAATNTPPPLSAGGKRQNRQQRDKASAKTSSASLPQTASDSAVSYQICDNCKNKYYKCSSKSHKSKSSSKCKSKSKDNTLILGADVGKMTSTSNNKKSTTTNSSIIAGNGSYQKSRSSDLLDRRLMETGTMPKILPPNESVSIFDQMKHYSTDDITFYTTSDDDYYNDDDEEDGVAVSSDSNNSVDSRNDIRCKESVVVTSKCQTGDAVTVVEAPPSTNSNEVDEVITTVIGITDVVSDTTMAVVTDIAEIADSSAVGNGNETAANSIGNASTQSNNSSSAGDASSSHCGSGGAGGNCNNSKPNVGGGSSNNRSKSRPDKLMLDLNDRSKYTKEVSV